MIAELEAKYHILGIYNYYPSHFPKSTKKTRLSGIHIEWK
jgi:hypothetical protein